MDTVGLLLAAGLSRRMGDFKPLMRVGGQTLVEACARSLLNGGVSRVVAVLGYRQAEVAEALKRTVHAETLTLAVNADYAATDMLASVRVGLMALPACDAFYLLPGDMPAVSPATFRALADTLQQTGASVAFPMWEGRRGHPPLIAARCIPTLSGYQGENGLRGVWRQFAGQTAELPTTDAGCAMDADTPEDFDALIRYLENR